jgi:cytochrome c553
MKKLVYSLFLCVLCLSAIKAIPAVRAGEDDRQAQRLATETCALCHGSEGRGSPPLFPALAAQTAPYLEGQLKAFRDQSRADPDALTYMWGMASNLNDETIGALARFYSSRSPAPIAALDPAPASSGKLTFDEGFPEKGVPACSSCHGGHGEGNGIIPRIGRQQTPYCYKQMKEFRDGLRSAPVMDEVSRHMTNQQFQAVCAYVGSL